MFVIFSSSNHQQSLQEGLEEMQQQYLTTVEKIRGWWIQIVLLFMDMCKV